MPDTTAKPITVHQILHRHFFRRFFDNDTLSVEGETETSVIRALGICAVPALMVAFWLIPHYPSDPPYRDLWAIAADRYFFVLYSFVAMGIVTTFEWEMLFPDRSDFLILLPLPLKARELFYAKARALLTFLGMFLAASNIFPLIFYAAESTPRKGNFLHTVEAHFAATMVSGIFAAMGMLAIEGLSIAALPDRLLRYVSPVVQALSITTMLTLLLLFPLISSHLRPLLVSPGGIARFIPPLWFLGLYEELTLGNAAPAAASSLAHIALTATMIASMITLCAYPAAWARQRKRALEGASQARGKRVNPVTAMLHKTLLRSPQQRAIFHFITQTVTRNTHYQVFLSIYAGVGLALVLASILTLKLNTSGGFTGGLSMGMSATGLHAVLPLLLFWLVVGLRSAFAFPVDMKARWVFPINLPLAGPVFQRAAKAAKLWILLCCGLLVCAVVSLLTLAKWPVWHLVVQAAWGIGLSVLMADLLFLGRTQIPFTRPRLPGREGLPLVLTLYAALFPALVLFTVKGELLAEQKGWFFAELAVAAIALHLALRAADGLAQKGIIGGFPEDEGEQGPQTLGLLASTQR